METFSVSTFTRFVHCQEMDTWYKTKFVDLNNASTKHIQSLQSLREESAGCKKDVSMTLNNFKINAKRKMHF